MNLLVGSGAIVPIFYGLFDKASLFSRRGREEEMRIKVPFEVAVAVTVVLLVIYFVFGMGYLASWLEKRFSKGRIRQVVRVLGVILALAAIPFMNTFLLEQDQRDEVYRGLYKFELGEVILTAILWAGAALCWFWARWRLAAIGLALVCGAVLIVKPIAWPLLSEWGAEIHEYGLTSETHLYFLLSGGALAVLGIVLAVRRKIVPTGEGETTGGGATPLGTARLQEIQRAMKTARSDTATRPRNGRGRLP